MTRLSGDTSNRNMLLIGTLVAAALIALALFAVKNKQAASTSTNGATVNFNLADTPFEGRADAPVTVVAVEDFKCPNCKNFQDTAAPQLKSQYVDSGKVKWYTLVWPFLSEGRVPEDDSKYAAQAAKCVYDQKGNEGFSTFKDILFRAQGDELKVWATKAYLKQLASNVEGLDAAKFATCLDTDATAARVEADKKQVVDAGVHGTPTIFVNGKQVNITTDYVKEIGAAIDAAAK